MKNSNIEFLRKKDYNFIEEIGQGGTGKTVLLFDELINEYFVCKKYSPYFKEHQDLFYQNFVQEIKLLHLLNHENIARVFNYYLYPEKKTGYILMEYIKGLNIKEYIELNPDKINDLFIQTVRGFESLEFKKILHRDIRPENILVSNSGIVKIIDLGFGKKIDISTDFDKSISLNWRYTVPNEIKQGIYDYKTEIYFVGKLFEECIKEFSIENFAYNDSLKKMIAEDSGNRINSFVDIETNILVLENPNAIEFSKNEQKIYINFGYALSEIITEINEDAQLIKDIGKIERLLEDCYKNSMLEYNLQDTVSLARCFLKGKFYYNRKKKDISVNIIKDFIGLLNSAGNVKKRIIMNNLWGRINSIPKYQINDDLPF